MYRQTYVEISHNNLTNNVKEIKKKYPEYKYYIGIVKNNAYHHGIKIVNALKKGGINYFAVSSLEEALELRKFNTDTPVLILEPIEKEYIYDCVNNNITITVENLEYLKEIAKLDIKYELKIHLKLDTGMNRLGLKSNEEVKNAIEILEKNSKLFLEGIYTHFATSGINDKIWDNQIEKFQELTKNVDLSKIPIVHLGRSLTLVNHPKISFCNGIRLGIIMYGFSQSQKKDTSLKGQIRNIKNNYLRKKYNISSTTIQNDLNLKTAFSLYSIVMSVRPILAGEYVGYNANFVSKENGYILTIPIGYADGVDKRFKYVYINNQRYQIVADTMDMIMIFANNKIEEGTKVEIFGEKITMQELSGRLHQNAYHIFNQIQNRVPRLHITDDGIEKTKY